MDDVGRTEQARDVDPGLVTPPMVRPRHGKGMLPIRSGLHTILGYAGSKSDAGRYYVAPRRLGGARRAVWFPADEAGWDAAWRSFERAEPGNAEDYRRQLARAAQSAAASAPVSPRRAAVDRLGDMLVVGGVLATVGVAMFVGCWLARSSALAEERDPSGLAMFVVIGAWMSLVGIAFALVGVVGWGVKLGREASDPEETRRTSPLDSNMRSR